jgi:hypothetical protein
MAVLDRSEPELEVPAAADLDAFLRILERGFLPA